MPETRLGSSAAGTGGAAVCGGSGASAFRAAPLTGPFAPLTGRSGALFAFDFVGLPDEPDELELVVPDAFRAAGTRAPARAREGALLVEEEGRAERAVDCATSRAYHC